PISYEQSNDALEHPAVQQLLNLAKIVVSIQSGDLSTANVLIANVLRHPMWQLEGMEVWQLAAQNFGRADWLTTLTKHKDKKLQTIGHWLLWLAAEADAQPLGVMIEYLLGLRASEHLTSPLQQHYLGNKVDGEYLAALSAIKLLLALVNETSRGDVK